MLYLISIPLSFCSSIDVCEAPSLKILCTVQQHHKIINALRWHHQHSKQPELHCLLASGSSNALVYIHDLHSAIGASPVHLVCLWSGYEYKTSRDKSKVINYRMANDSRDKQKT